VVAKGARRQPLIRLGSSVGLTARFDPIVANASAKLRRTSAPFSMADDFDDINPRPRLLMGPGPINADPRVLRAMSAQLLGQFDPQFTGYMNEVMALYRRVFQTRNRWTFTIDGTARAAIEAVLVSVLEPGDRVLVPIFGRFGHLLVEIAERVGADVRTIETAWGTVFAPEQVEALVAATPKRPEGAPLRLCHAGSVYGRRDIRPIIEAVAQLNQRGFRCELRDNSDRVPL